MSFSMCVSVYVCGDLVGTYKHVLNIDHNCCYVRVFLSDGAVKCFFADDDCSLKVSFEEDDDYPF